MIVQSTFEEYLSTDVTLRDTSLSYIGQQGEQLSQWAVNLSLLSESDQCIQIEKVLGELMVANMADSKRLKIMETVLVAVERLVAQLHNFYIHESGQLDIEQLRRMAQVNSLYYMSILVYHGVLKRETKDRVPRSFTKQPVWKRLLPLGKAQPSDLAVTIYWLISLYQKLIFETALAYQKPSSVIWQQLNYLYLLARQEDIADIDLSGQINTRHAKTIHEIYCQTCLYNILNLSMYRRQDIVGISRVLPRWAEHMTASMVPQSETRIFVNLESEQPPEYLTPYTKINPYDDKHKCLFIELMPMLEYLGSRRQVAADQEDDLSERRLIDKTLMTVQHQYMNRQRRDAPRFMIKQQATLITGFNRIHYHLAGKSSLGNLIRQDELLDIYLPKYSTRPKRGETNIMVEVELVDQSVTGYRFRTKATIEELHQQNNHLSDPYDVLPDAPPNSNEAGMQSTLFNSESMPKSKISTAPPLLQVMSLFAMRLDSEAKDTQWALGIIRWIETSQDHMEAGGQLLGYSATACGIRLENNDSRSQDFVAALLIAGDDTLKTKSSLMLPRYHFREGDRVILRIQNKQTTLRLERNITSTDDMEQFEIIKLPNQI